MFAPVGKPGLNQGGVMAATRIELVGLIKQSVKDFIDDDCMDSAAALSYYTIFSLPAVLVLLLMLLKQIQLHYP